MTIEEGTAATTNGLLSLIIRQHAMIRARTIDYWACRLAHRKAISRRTIFSRPGTKMLDLKHSWVRVRTHGDGPNTVVFLCDAPNAIEHYDALLRQVRSSGYRGLVIEMPGFGCSYPKHSYSFSLEAQSAVLSDALTGLGVFDACLVAPCVTAYSGLRLAEMRPDLVRNLCLIQAPSWQDECAWARRIDRAFLRVPVVGQLIMASFAQRVTDKWYHAAMRDPDQTRAFSIIGRRRLEDGGCFSLASLTQCWFGASEPVFGERQDRTLVIWGAHDRTHNATDKWSILQYASAATRQVIENAGHSPELEQPTQTWGRIQEWLLRSR